MTEQNKVTELLMAQYPGVTNIALKVSDLGVYYTFDTPAAKGNAGFVFATELAKPDYKELFL